MGEKITSRAAGQPGCVFAGSDCTDRPFFRALHLRQFSLKPPFTEQKGKSGPCLSYAFQHQFHTVRATNSDSSLLLPTPLLISQVPNFLDFFSPQLPVQPPSIFKRWHTLHSACAEFKQAPEKETLWKTPRVFVLCLAEHHGGVTESTTVLGPSLPKCL